MRIFCVTQSAGIAFRVGSSYKNAQTHMRTFEMAQNAGIAFRVRFFQSDFASAYCV
jgi:hypothetical protein